jgi:hypothetical protein
MYALSGLLLRTLMCGKIYQILLNLATKSRESRHIPRQEILFVTVQTTVNSGMEIQELPDAGVN